MMTLAFLTSDSLQSPTHRLQPRRAEGGKNSFNIDVVRYSDKTCTQLVTNEGDLSPRTWLEAGKCLSWPDPFQSMSYRWQPVSTEKTGDPVWQNPHYDDFKHYTRGE
jgi:hypothetical protein